MSFKQKELEEKMEPRPRASDWKAIVYPSDCRALDRKTKKSDMSLRFKQTVECVFGSLKSQLLFNKYFL